MCLCHLLALFLEVSPTEQPSSSNFLHVSGNSLYLICVHWRLLPTISSWADLLSLHIPWTRLTLLYPGWAPWQPFLDNEHLCLFCCQHGSPDLWPLIIASSPSQGALGIESYLSKPLCLELEAPLNLVSSPLPILGGPHSHTGHLPTSFLHVLVQSLIISIAFPHSGHSGKLSGRNLPFLRLLSTLQMCFIPVFQLKNQVKAVIHITIGFLAL